MKKREVIIACDFASAAQTLAFLDRFEEEKPYVKIGMELYYAAGPSMVETLRERGYKIFLDLKLHDIPNTVKKAMAVLAGLGVDMTILHAAGGIDMMRAAIEGLTVDGVRRTKCIAVTQLTSTSQQSMEEEIGIHAVRIGNVVGTHEVLLSTGTQTLTLRHEAHDRRLFAEGALMAASFLADLPRETHGLYGMRDLL